MKVLNVCQKSGKHWTHVTEQKSPAQAMAKHTCNLSLFLLIFLHCWVPTTQVFPLISSASQNITNLENKNNYDGHSSDYSGKCPSAFSGNYRTAQHPQLGILSQQFAKPLQHSSEVSHGTGNFWSCSFCWVFKSAFNSSHLISVLYQICRYTTAVWLIEGIYLTPAVSNTDNSIKKIFS